MAHSIHASVTKLERGTFKILEESVLTEIQKISTKEKVNKVIDKNGKSYFDENGFPVSDYHNVESGERITSPFEKAVQVKCRAMIENITTSVKDINNKTYNNETMLHVAASYEDEETVALLIQCGADVNSTNGRGETPLFIAAAKENLMILCKLISAGAEVNFTSDDGDTPLHRAVFERMFKNVLLLVLKGADVKAKNKLGLTPLHVAICSRAIKELISRGADINAKSIKGDTPTHSFVYKDSLEGIKLLIKAKAKMNLPNNNGLTPLCTAALTGNSSIVRFLVSRAKVPVDGKDLLGNAPLHYATMKGWLDTVKRLLLKRADPNVRGEHGYTPLHIAAIFGHLTVIHLLLKKGADVTAEDESGNTPIELAKAHKQNDIFKALKSYIEDLKSKIDEKNDEN